MLRIVSYGDNRQYPFAEGAGYFFLLRCLTSKITSVIIATISKPKVSIIIIASNVVMAYHPGCMGEQQTRLLRLRPASFRLEYNYPPPVEASPKTKKSVPPSCLCVTGIIMRYYVPDKLFYIFQFTYFRHITTALLCITSTKFEANMRQPRHCGFTSI